MPRLLLTALAAFIAGGLVFAAWYPTQPEPEAVFSRPERASTGRSSAGSLEQRVAALEQALVVEREARQLLEDELFYLSDSLEEDDGQGDRGRATASAGLAPASESVQARATTRRRSRSNDPEVRLSRLIENGFSPQEAGRILQRESELRMEGLQARYEAQISGENSPRTSVSASLREELGDEGYERYLLANDRPASVTVTRVYESSPALSAGMLPGDEITRYDGSRVFSLSDVAQQTLEGVPGENVTVEIVRNGVPMQITVPRGPLGISAGRRGRR